MHIEWGLDQGVTVEIDVEEPEGAEVFLFVRGETRARSWKLARDGGLEAGDASREATAESGTAQ
jgi:hypothetical protein